MRGWTRGFDPGLRPLLAASGSVRLSYDLRRQDRRAHMGDPRVPEEIQIRRHPPQPETDVIRERLKRLEEALR